MTEDAAPGLSDDEGEGGHAPPLLHLTAVIRPDEFAQQFEASAQQAKCDQPPPPLTMA